MRPFDVQPGRKSFVLVVTDCEGFSGVAFMQVIYVLLQIFWLVYSTDTSI